KNLGGHVGKSAQELVEIFAFGKINLVEIEAAVHLQLQRLHAALRVAIIFGDEPASIGPVYLNVVAGALQGVADKARELGVAGGAEAVAQHEVGPPPRRLADGGGRRHRVAVDENGDAKAPAGGLQQLGQGGVERAIQALDALEGGADGQPLAIDLL